jgi:hypothetical protein
MQNATLHFHDPDNTPLQAKAAADAFFAARPLAHGVWDMARAEVFRAKIKCDLSAAQIIARAEASMCDTAGEQMRCLCSPSSYSPLPLPRAGA